MGEEMKCLRFRRRGSSGMEKRTGHSDIEGTIRFSKGCPDVQLVIDKWVYPNQLFYTSKPEGISGPVQM